MHHGGPPAARRDRESSGEERGLSTVTFVGSFPAADFHVQPDLPEVAFLGRSNVGKSSLLNSLVGRRAMARTSKTPGKTRACNVYRVEDRLHLVDLPGYGYARLSRRERQRLLALIRRYVATRRALAGVVWLLDVRRDPSTEDRDMASHLAARGVPVLLAVAKADKLGRGRRIERVRAILAATDLPEGQCIVTSSLTREGTRELREAIERLAVRRSGAQADDCGS